MHAMKYDVMSGSCGPEVASRDGAVAAEADEQCSMTSRRPEVTTSHRPEVHADAISDNELQPTSAVVQGDYFDAFYAVLTARSRQTTGSSADFDLRHYGTASFAVAAMLASLRQQQQQQLHVTSPLRSMALCSRRCCWPANDDDVTMSVARDAMTPSNVAEPRLELETGDLWRQFSRLTTEMVITKSGRRMFPALKFRVYNLTPLDRYYFLLDIVPVDCFRYKFHDSRWTTSTRLSDEDDPWCRTVPPIYHVHPDSPASGHVWMSKPLSFHRAKLTNNMTDSQGHLVLCSMHRYQPRVHLVRLCDDGSSQLKTFVFTETQFIAVTAYQNTKITRLKIENNPFAKGFRDIGSNVTVKSKNTRISSNTMQHVNHFQPYDVIDDVCLNDDSLPGQILCDDFTCYANHRRWPECTMTSDCQQPPAIADRQQTTVADFRGQILRPLPLKLSTIVSPRAIRIGTTLRNNVDTSFKAICDVTPVGIHDDCDALLTPSHWQRQTGSDNNDKHIVTSSHHVTHGKLVRPKAQRVYPY